MEDILFLLCWSTETNVQAQKVEVLEDNAGLYYDEIGLISFYPFKWKIVNFINLVPTRDLWRQTKEHQKTVKRRWQ